MRCQIHAVLRPCGSLRRTCGRSCGVSRNGDIWRTAGARSDDYRDARREEAQRSFRPGRCLPLRRFGQRPVDDRSGDAGLCNHPHTGKYLCGRAGGKMGAGSAARGSAHGACKSAEKSNHRSAGPGGSDARGEWQSTKCARGDTEGAGDIERSERGWIPGERQREQCSYLALLYESRVRKYACRRQGALQRRACGHSR